VVLLIGAALVTTDALGGGDRPETGRTSSSADQTPPPQPPPTTTTPTAAPSAQERVTALKFGPVSVPTVGFLSWAVLDRRTGQISGSANFAAPSDTMSMVKAWLAADYLRMAGERGQPPSEARLYQLRIMIRDSDNNAAQNMYGVVGGRASIVRMVSVCGLTDSRPYDRPYWSNTVVSARDTVRLGACIADGRAAGPRWTGWLLGEMRHVRGVGDFGVRTTLPDAVARTVAVKNGWLLRDEDGLWHISCLAIARDWVVGTLARYPGRLGFGYGTELCRRVGAQLVGSG
jgi:hypothetical protein